MIDKLSFADVNLLTDDIAEITVHSNVELTLAMVAEVDQFLTEKFSGPFSILINKINFYDYTFEAQVSVALHESLVAIAIVTYDNRGEQSAKHVWSVGEQQDWKLQLFNGVESGWLEAYQWLKSEMKLVANLVQNAGKLIE